MSFKLSKGKNLEAKRWGFVLLLLNIVGAVIYVSAASNGWVRSQERGLIPVTGEPFVWAGYVFPIWAVFLLLNLVWGVFIVARRRWRTGIWWLAIVPVWLIAMAIDFAHH